MSRRFNKGDRYYLPLHTLNSSDAPAWADAAITVKVYDSGGNLDKTVYFSPMDRFRHTGLMTVNFLIDLDPGFYIAVCEWAEDSNDRITLDNFEVKNAGDAEGAINEIYDHLGPGPANGLIYQTETGKISFGRHPR